MRVKTQFEADKTFVVEGFYDPIDIEKVSKDPKTREKEYFSHLNQLVSASVQEAAGIKEQYISAISNDNRISSQERGDLMKELDEFLLSVVNLREMLMMSIDLLKAPGSPKRKKGESETTDYGKFTFTGFANSQKFRIDGKINNKDISANKTFTHWHDESFIKKLKNMLLDYHKSISDNILTSSEVDTLLKESGEIIYEAILMRYLIQHLLIDE